MGRHYFLAAGAASAVRGETILAFENDKDGERRRKSQPDDDEGNSGEKSSRSPKRPPAPAVGNALRSAYEQTVNEDIPQEMLDLLGKLG